MSTCKTSSSHVDNFLFSFWLFSYGIIIYILTNTWVQFERKFFRDAMHRARRKTFHNKYMPPSSKWASWVVQSSDSHTTTSLCCLEQENLKLIRASNNLLVQHTGMQVHKHDPPYSCVLSAPAWTISIWSWKWHVGTSKENQKVVHHTIAQTHWPKLE